MPNWVIRTLRAGGEISDLELDALYPDWVRRASDTHFTPLEVARRAAELLVHDASTRVLDVGSGSGKFCLIGALCTEGSFYGVEQRAGLVRVAEETAARCGVDRVRYLHQNLTTIDWSPFDAFYLFNPFYEHLAEDQTLIEERIEHVPALFRLYVDTTCARLEEARPGTRVVTYQGFGGVMPAAYRRLLCEPAGDDYLELWQKERG